MLAHSTASKALRSANCSHKNLYAKNPSQLFMILNKMPYYDIDRDFYYRDFYNPDSWTIENVRGARCACYAKFLHPKDLVREHYPDAAKSLRFEELVVLRQGVKVVRGKESQFVWVEHQLPSGETIELHANLKWIVFRKEE